MLIYAMFGALWFLFFIALVISFVFGLASLITLWKIRRQERVGVKFIRFGTRTLLFLFLLLVGLACNKTTLAPDGAYRGNIWLYEIDQTAADSKATLGEFINWARANYPALHAQHRDDVLETAESIRNNAPGWFHAADAARTTYTNALYTGASPAALNDASNALFTLTGVIQSHARTASPLTNSLAP